MPSILVNKQDLALPTGSSELIQQQCVNAVMTVTYELQIPTQSQVVLSRQAEINVKER